ncbi:DUF4919 domain-containing protein [Saccharicrinis sp. FJH2]|uniref:DUF4919 domain-containing protein n=1 Tax=Saccharicrinis sp. FJH65 TaxID=3344659 RepID=UPI0035F3FD72
MKHLLTTLLLLILTFNAISQELDFKRPDYKSIEKEIKQKSSDFYYPVLMKRFVELDTTLTLDDYRYLYYGYIFQKEYEAYWTSPYQEKLLKYYRSTKIKRKEYDKIIDLSNKSINEFPFDLRSMNFLAYTYHLKGDEEMAIKVSKRFHGIIEAILSTGSGETCKDGYHVISVSHEYVILNMFLFQMKSQALIGNCDYLEFEKDERNIDGLYFNIEKILETQRKMFK